MYILILTLSTNWEFYTSLAIYILYLTPSYDEKEDKIRQVINQTKNSKENLLGKSS